MATKTFKIGLSATDKQNMAQDVYERVLDLTFPEYETTASYSVGEFVVYNDQLYKCIGATSGTWDSTKWQLATLNDLVNDIEDAVQFVNDKANVDGNYPTLTAGLADNLTPYSEDSGDTQDNPFISQGTGTNNNNEIVTVGDYGLLRQKQGHTLVVNQMLRELSAAYWTSVDSSVTFNNGVATFTANAQNGRIYRNSAVGLTASKHYLLIAKIKLTTPTTEVSLSVSGAYPAYTQETTAWQTLYKTFSPSYSANEYVRIQDGRESGWDAIQVSQVCFIDLTQMFNGDIPQDLLDNPSHFSWYYNGSLAYNTGTLGNANSEILVSTGRQLWDEEWETGSIDNDGQPVVVSNRFRSKNFIPVVPDTDYYFYYAKNQTTGARTLYFYWYDKDKNFISGGDEYLNVPVKHSPANACFLKIRTGGGNPEATYGNDITISLYYTPAQGGEGYDQYYPYEAPYVVDTGDEVLRQAGSVKDYKTPDGVVHRKVIEIDMGDLTPVPIGYGCYFYSVQGVKAPSSNDNAANMTCSKYQVTSRTYLGYGNEANPFHYGCIAMQTDGYIALSDQSLSSLSSAQIKQALAGQKLYLEVIDETTEQGTTFSENLPINDYGMLYWQESNGVPQGAEIFYPVNYKGFIDDVYSRTSGDAEQLVIQSELSASETARDTVDAQLQNAIGGTLRQCLCVKESLDFDNTDFVDMGELNYNYYTNGGANVFYYIINGMKANGKVLSTLYKTTNETYNVLTNMCITTVNVGFGSGAYIFVKNTAYTDATTFKNAMKNVLLAYEKA